jgi:hypothetical protein
MGWALLCNYSVTNIYVTIWLRKIFLKLFFPAVGFYTEKATTMIHGSGFFIKRQSCPSARYLIGA